MDIDELIATAKKQVETVEPVEQEVLLGDKLVIVQLRPLDGEAWTELTAEHPPRPRVPKDRELGYNVLGVLRAFPNVSIVDGDEVDDLTRTDEDGNKVSRWPAVVGVLGSPDIKNLTIALWGVHEWEHHQRVAAAGKASKSQRLRKKRR